jgi:hypothetical protein
MKVTRAIVVGFAVCLLTVGFAGAGGVSADEAAADEAVVEKVAEHQFVGAAKCKMCHNSAKQGKIYDAWMASAHAKAYETLASDAAKKVAAEKGIEDPQKADACLKCHVTGHGAKAELLGTKYDAAEGVGCESCHGAGGDYWKNTTMKAISAGETDGASVGLLTPDEKTCVGCHNEENPNHPGEFKFDEMWAKIKHAKPAAE